MTSNSFRKCLYLCVLMTVYGCSTSPKAKDGDAQSDAGTEVLVQICLPNKRVYFRDMELDRLQNHPQITSYSQQQLALAPKTIRRIVTSNDPRAIRDYGVRFGEVLMRSGQLSDGSGAVFVKDATVSDQPVYERGYGYATQEYVAIHVRLPSGESGMAGDSTYWFTLPKVVPAVKFTNWFNPVSMESEQVRKEERNPIWWKLTHGANLPIYPVSTDAPKIRVKLGRQNTEHKDPTNDLLPALTTARLRYKTSTSGSQFVYEFVPKSIEKIPSCD